MSMKELEIIRLEDRVLFEAAAAAEIMEAQQNDPNADMNHTDQQAQDEKNAIKNAPPENLADATVEPGIMPQPDKVGDIDAEIQALIEGEIGFSDAGADAYADAINGLVNDFGADAVNDTIHDAFAPKDLPLSLTNSDANLSIGIERELVIISTDVENTDALIAGLNANQEVLVLEDGDAMAQIKNYLDTNGETYKAIHLVARGNSGYLVVNGEVIDSSNFNAADWADIGSHITDDGDILLYSDNLAANEAGRELAGMIADASGADVTANTGTAYLSGSYALDFQTGDIEATVLSIDGSALNLTAYTVNGEHHELVIINSSVKDADKIAAQFADGTDFLYLDSDRDALEQINEYLDKNGVQYDVMRIFSHGNAGYFALSGKMIDSAYVAANSDAFADIGSHLAADGDIMLYGCNLAANDAGKALVNELAVITGADVAASTDTTGIGGNWDLEYHVGVIQAAGFTIDNYDYRLENREVTSALDDNSAGTLRYVINDSTTVDGDEIVFNIADNDTIVLGSVITITKDITINGKNQATTNNITIKVTTTYAENNASTCNYRVFDITGNVTIENATLKGGNLTTTNGINGDGGTVRVSGTASLELKNVTISESRAGRNGGGLSFDSTGTLTITDSAITGNTGLLGGGVYLTKGILTISGSEITGNKATTVANGGGLHILSSGDIDISNTDISGNTGGAGILMSTMAATTTVSITDTTVTGNTAGGGIIYSGAGSMSISGGEVSGNNRAGSGAGINITSTGTSTFELSDFDITNNKATVNASCGGGIYFNGGGSLSLDTLTISGNSTTGTTTNHGGGIYFAGTATLTFNNVPSILNNSAGGAGGGMYYASSAALTITGMTFSGNSSAVANGAGLHINNSGNVSISNSFFNANTVGAGVALANMSATATVSITNTQAMNNLNGSGISYSGAGSMTISGGEVSGNKKAGSGVGIAITSTGDGTTTFNLSGFDITNNKATGNGSCGGGIYFNGSGSLSLDTLTISDNGTTGNTTNYGGGIYFAGTATLTFINIPTISNNSASTGSGGGMYYASSAALTITGMTFSGNSSAVANGAGLHINNSGNVSISNSFFNANTVGAGVALANMSATATVSITNTQAMDNLNGSGISYSGAGSMSISGGEVSGNKKSGNGAGIYINSSGDGTTTFNLSGFDVKTNNTTANNNQGGGIWFSGTGTLSLTNINVTGNSATGGTGCVGGGIWFTSTDDHTLVYSNLNISNNNSVGAAAGLYYNSSADLTISGMSFTSNTAAGNGGAIHATGGGNLTVTGSTFTTNRGVGGAIYMTGAGDLTVTNSTFTGNTAGTAANANGAAIHSVATGNVSIGNTTITGVIGTTYGGGIFINNSAAVTAPTMTFTNITVSNNTANNNGGGIGINTKGAVTMTDVEITGNTGLGGGIYMTGGGSLTLQVATLPANLITGNKSTAAGNGGGIHFASAGNLQISNSDVSGNTAGAGIYITGATASSTATITDTTVTGNTNGGGIYYNGEGSMTISGGEVSGNKKAGSGAGIAITSSGTETFALSNFDITGNNTNANGQHGGGIYFTGTGTLSLTNVGVTGNSTAGTNNTSHGGGIYFTGSGTLTLAGTSDISNNIAVGAGGGLYYNGSANLTINGINFTGNKSAVANGGGIHFASAGNFQISNSDVSGNTAGAGIYITDATASSTATIIDTTVTGNTNGGGIYYSGEGSMSISGTAAGKTVVSGNNKAGVGGGICINTTGDGTFSLSGFDVTTNTINGKFSGAGIYFNATGTSTAGLSLNGVNVTSNTNIGTSDANSHGGGIFFSSANGGSLTLTNVTNISGNTNGGAGGGLYYASSANLTINGISFTGNKSAVANGGGIHFNSVGNLQISNSDVSGNTAGAGILITGATASSTATIIDTKITNNANGGGIYYTGLGSMSISGTAAGKTVVSGNNKAGVGGGICINTTGDGTFSLSGFDVTTNTINGKFSGAGIYFNATGTSTAGLSLNGVNVTSNTNIGTSDANSHGGGIFFSSANGASLTLTNVTNISGNTNGGAGGGIYYNSTADLTISGIAFSTNKGSTGGIYFAGGGDLTVSGSTFTGNTSTTATNGAGIHVATGGDVSISNTGITGNTGAGIILATMTNATTISITDSNVSSNTNAGISITGMVAASTVTITDTTVKNNATAGGGISYTGEGSMSISGGEVSGNKKAGSGGGIYFSNAGSGNLSLSDININGNEASGNANSHGGGIYFLSSNGGSLNYNNINFDNNIAAGNGAGLYYSSSADLTFTDTIFTGDLSGSNGGALYVAGGASLTILRCEFTGNKGVGAGIYLTGGGDLTITDSDISDNTGSGISMSGGGIFTITNSTVSNHTGTGIILSGSGGTIDECTISLNNNSGVSFTAAYKTLTVINGTFSYNKAGTGGAITVGADSTLDITSTRSLTDTATGTLFYKNEATGYGGAIGGPGTGSIINIKGNNTVFRENFVSRAELGYGGAIYFQTQLNITGNNVLFEGNTSLVPAGTSADKQTNGGGALYARDNTASIFIDAPNIKFIGNLASNYGGAILCHGALTITEASKALFQGNLIVGESSSGGGGAIYVGFRSAGTAPVCTITNVRFIGNGESPTTINSANDGGAILTHGGDLSVNKCVFDGNTSNAYGGAVSSGTWGLTRTGTVTITNCEFTDNEAKNGGAISTTTARGYGSVTVKNSTFDGNEATTHGGAIYYNSGTFKIIDDPASSSVKLTSFSNNKADQNGGAIYSTKALDLTGIVFDGNWSKGTTLGTYIAHRGGAIYMNADLTLTDCTFLNNETKATDGGGGAIYTNAALTIKNTSFTGNKASLTGGAIFFNSSSSLKINDNNTKPLTFFTSNEAGGSGGAIYAAGGTLSGFTGIVFTTNKATGTAAESNGGAIWTSRALTLTDSTFTGNQALKTTGDGGAIFTSAALTLINTGFTGNTAGNNGGAINSSNSITINDAAGTQTSFTNNQAGQNGGAIYSTGSLAGFTNIAFSGNKAIAGNGGALWTNKAVVLNGGSFTGNTAGNNGGAIYVTDSGITVTLNSVTIGGSGNSNTAANGGGVYVDNSAKLVMNGTTAITYNIASQDGGGIYAKTGTLELNSGSISNNYAGSDTTTSASSTGGNGGGIWSAVTLDIDGSVNITGNTARTNAFGENGLGGGIYSSANVTLTSATIDENKAKNGGGIYMLSGTLSMTGSTISDNTADIDGGGIYLTGPALISTMETVTVSGNEATNNGGGIYYESSDAISLTMNNVTISNNTVDTTIDSCGGGMYIFSAETVELTIEGTSTISDNSGAAGGGIYVYAEDTITLNIGDGTNAVTFADNNADIGGGGAIYVLLMNNVDPGASVDINIASGSVFDTNHSTTHGGAIVISADEGAVNIDIAGTGTVFTGNNVGDPSSYGQGGVFYLQVGKDIAMTIGDGTKFTSNWAQDVGGVLYLTGDNITLDIGKNVLFEGNKSTEGIAGAIYACAGNENHINIGAGTVFNGNEAYLRGGAIHAVASDSRNTWIDLDQVTFTGNIAERYDGGAIYTDGDVKAVNSVFENNRAGRNGGAMFLSYGIADITGGNFTNNIAENNGGAIYLGYLDDTLADTSIVTGTQFLNNKAVNGGAIWSGEDGELTVNGGIFGAASGNGNTATTGSGGAIYAAGTLTVGNDGAKHSEFYHNSATNGNGGAIWAADATVNGAIFGATGTSNSGNTAKNGGAIHADTLTVNSAEFYRNSATENGGAVYAKDALVYGSIFGTATAATVTDPVGNSAVNGGAIYSVNNLTVSSNAAGKHSEFYRNKATKNGGAIYLGGTGTVSGSIFGSAGTANSGNSATENGGAIYANGNLIINTVGSHRSEFYRNTASENGGAVYGAANVTVNNAIFGNTDSGTGNKAQNGGAIFANGNVSVSNGSEFYRNNATNGHGGAIFAQGNVDIDGSGFYRNTATEAGGAVYGGAKVTVSNAIFGTTESGTGNSAENGGAIFANGDADISDSKFYRNSASNGNGGALYAASAATIIDSTFSYNTASENGGAAYVNGNLTMDRTSMTNNTASTASNGDGGALWAGGTNVSVRNSLIAENSTTNGSGGGIYLHYYVQTASLVNLTIANNYAIKGNGGGIYLDSTMPGTDVLVANSILWGNKAKGTDNPTDQTANIASAAIVFSAIQGWTGGHQVQGNINLQADNSGTNRAVKKADGTYEYYCYVEFDSNYELTANSYAINRGDNSHVLAGETDLVKAGRIFNEAGGGRVDMGAYESNRKGNVIVIMDPIQDIVYGDDGALGANRDGYGTGGYHYSSGNENYVTVSNDRALAVQAKGNVTMTAFYDGDDNWNKASGTETVNTLVRLIEIQTLGDTYDYDGTYHKFTWDPNAIGGRGFAFTDSITSEVDSPSYRNAGTHKGELYKDSVVITNASDVKMTGNYDIRILEGTMIINQVVLIVNREGTDKVYNGNTDAQYTFTGFTGGYIAGDDVNYIDGSSASFADKNVGDGKAITINGEDVSGTDLVNYIVKYSDVKANITQAELIVNREGIDKVYNGNTDAQYTFTGFTGGYVPGDDINYIDGSSASFADKNVGDGKAITINGEDVSGTDLVNYIVKYSDVKANITQAELIVNREGIDKVYNGNTDAQYTFTGFTGGYVPGDDINYIDGSSASFSDKNVGDGKTITINGEDVNGTDIGNYIVKYSDVEANITPATLVVNREGISKVYDGNTDAQYTFTGFTGGYVPGDDINYIDGSRASFSDKNVGDGKQITINGEDVNGTDIGNYIIQYSDVKANITPATLVVNREGIDKVYDGNTDAQYTFTGFTGGYVPGDDLNYIDGSGSFADKNAGTNKPITINGEDVTGTDTVNYIITYSDVKANISKAALVINRDGVDKVYDGTNKGDYNFSYDPDHKPVDGDDVHYDKGTATFTDRNAGNDKPLVINGDSLYGDDLANYDVTINDPTASITPARLIIVIDDKSKQENQADPKFTGTPTGLVDGDTVSDYNRTNKSEREGKYAIDQYHLNDGNGGQNYIVEVHNGTLTIIGEARINIYKDASSRNYIVDGQDEFSLMHQVTILGVNRDADTILDTETGGNHHGVSHQSMHKAGDKARNNLREGSLKVMFEQHDANMTIRDNRSALSRSDVFSSGSEKNGIADSQVVNAKKDAASSLSSGRGGVSQVQSVSDRSLDFTSESTHPMNNMPSSISLETLENSVNFSANVEMTDAVWQEKVECLKSKLDLILEEMMLV